MWVAAVAWERLSVLVLVWVWVWVWGRGRRWG